MNVSFAMGALIKNKMGLAGEPLLERGAFSGDGNQLIKMTTVATASAMPMPKLNFLNMLFVLLTDFVVSRYFYQA